MKLYVDELIDIIVKSSNPEVIKACAAAIQWIDINGKGGCDPWKDGDTELHRCTLNGVPHDDVKAISKQFPDDIINCQYNFERENFSVTHIMEYRNGEVNIIGIEPYYSWHVEPLNYNHSDVTGIYEKAVSYCRMLDKVEKDKDGKLFVNWFPGEVIFKFEYDGAEGQKYLIEVNKISNQLYIEIFEGLVKYGWQDRPIPIG